MAKNQPPPPSLDELQRKIDAAVSEGKRHEPKPAIGSGYGTAMRHSLDVIAGVGVGGTMGYLLDKALGSLPLFLIIFFLLGFAAGFRNIIRNANRTE